MTNTVDKPWTTDEIVVALQRSPEGQTLPDLREAVGAGPADLEEGLAELRNQDLVVEVEGRLFWHEDVEEEDLPGAAKPFAAEEPEDPEEPEAEEREDPPSPVGTLLVEDAIAALGTQLREGEELRVRAEVEMRSTGTGLELVSVTRVLGVEVSR